MIDDLTDDHTTSNPDELAARYQQLWASSAPVDLGSFVREHSPLDGACLVELVRIDLIERARGNLRKPLEAYLDEFPALTEQREWVLDLLDAEICCAENCGKMPETEDYLRRFPAYADEIRVMFEIQAWEHASSQTVFPSDTSKADESVGGATAETDFDDRLQIPRQRSTSDYQLGDVLGRGASGIVCKARDLKLDRVVAIKRLRTGDAATERDRLRFQTEAQAAARLSHPNIVKILDFGDLDGEPFLAMEYIGGRSLKERFADGPLPVSEAVCLGQQIAEALHYAHLHRVLHRDIKPGNILIDMDGRPLISDFGLAKRLGETAGLTSTGDVLGTPGYMSPEQALGERGQVTVRSDVYGLGGLLYAMVTGRPPITGGDIADTLRRVILDDPTPPRQWNSAVDRDLETIILKCLDKSPSKRYGTAAELAEELARHRRGEPIAARPLRRHQRVWRWCKRRPWPAAAIFLAGLTVLLVTALAVTATVAAVKDRGMRLQMERERDDAERMRRLAESHQTRFQHKLAALQLQDNRFSDAERELRHLPPNIASYDTRRLAFEAQALPRSVAVLADGHWGIVCAAMHPDGRRLIASDAGGALVLWDLESAKVVTRLAQPRWLAPDNDRFRAGRPNHYLLGRTAEDGSMLQWELCCADLVWDGDSSRAVAASLNGMGIVFDTDSGNQTTILQAPEPLYAVARAADAGHFLFGGAEGGLYLRTLDGAAVSERRLDNQAITVVFAMPGNLGWLVGTESGQLLLLEPQSLESRAALEVPGPIWGVDVWDAGEEVQIAVACESSEVLVVGYGGAEFTPSGSYWLPAIVGSQTTAHAVRFVDQGRSLCAITNLRQLVQWNTDSGQMRFSIDCMRRDQRRADLKRVLTLSDPLLPMPLPLRRVGACLLARPNVDEQLVFGGEDAAIHVWDVAEISRGNIRPLDVQVGADPHVMFDRDNRNVLWVLDRPGTLWAIDSREDRVIAKTAAHPEGVAGLDLLKHGVVVTAGADGSVRFWRLQAGRLRTADRKSLAHDRPLLSIAVDPGQRWAAAVDDRSRLVMWDLETGLLRFLRPLSAPEQPLTGRLAFNLDGSRLCAFGAGQNAMIFDTQSLAALDQQAVVAGGGGVALAWSPRDKGLLLIADDFGRYAATSLGEPAPPNWGSSRLHPAPAKAMKASPDGRRILSLEQGGRLRLWESEFLIEMHDIEHPQGWDADVALDSAANRLAWASRDGQIEIWETETLGRDDKTLQPSTVLDDRNRWETTLLVQPMAALLHVNERTIAVDGQGRVNVAYTIASRDDYRRDGELHFLRVEPEGLRVERLAAGNSVADRRVEPEAFCLALQPGGEPCIAYRRRTEIASPYDGDLLLATRMPSGDWHYETIAPNGNWGFTPALVWDDAGEVHEIIHYGFHAFNLLRTVRTAAGDWYTEPLGNQGFGLRFLLKQDSQGIYHFLSTSHRFNGDPRPALYARWDGQHWQQEIPSFSGRPTIALSLMPDGRPVIQSNGRLLIRQQDTWEELCHLPADVAADRQQQFAIDTRGHVHMALWDPSTRHVSWYRHDGTMWQATVVADVPDSLNEPNFLFVHVDKSLQPRILHGSTTVHGGWLALAQVPVKSSQ